MAKRRTAPKKRTTNKGRYTPNNPDKYLGDHRQIIFRSSWELRFFEFCDRNPNVIKWASEEIKIPYHKPTDVGANRNKVRHYYPDVYLEVQNKHGERRKYLVEIKPMKEVAVTSKSSMYDKISILINEAKWKAAKCFCDKQGIEFKIVTEHSLFRLD